MTIENAESERERNTRFALICCNTNSLGYTQLRIAIALSYVAPSVLLANIAKSPPPLGVDAEEVARLAALCPYPSTFFRMLAVRLSASSPTAADLAPILAVIGSELDEASVGDPLMALSAAIRANVTSETGRLSEVLRRLLSARVKFLEDVLPAGVAEWLDSELATHPADQTLNACFGFYDLRHCPSRKELQASEESLARAIVHWQQSEATLGGSWRAACIVESAVWLAR